MIVDDLDGTKPRRKAWSFCATCSVALGAASLASYKCCNTQRNKITTSRKLEERCTIVHVHGDHGDHDVHASPITVSSVRPSVRPSPPSKLIPESKSEFKRSLGTCCLSNILDAIEEHDVDKHGNHDLLFTHRKPPKPTYVYACAIVCACT